jgi:hypothetical protein
MKRLSLFPVAVPVFGARLPGSATRLPGSATVEASTTDSPNNSFEIDLVRFSDDVYY